MPTPVGFGEGAGAAAAATSVATGDSATVEFGRLGLSAQISRAARQPPMNRLSANPRCMVSRRAGLTLQIAPGNYIGHRSRRLLTAAVLHHPNIVPIHEIGIHAGQHHFSMDFVEGPSLAVLVGHVPISAWPSAWRARPV